MAPVFIADAGEIYELRLVLDPWALRCSLERSDAAHRAEVAAAYQRLVDAVSRSSSSDDRVTLEVHRAFHAMLLAGTQHFVVKVPFGARSDRSPGDAPENVRVL